jgi:hypothetical protein
VSSDLNGNGINGSTNGSGNGNGNGPLPLTLPLNGNNGNGAALKFASDRLKDDPDVVLAAMRQVCDRRCSSSSGTTTTIGGVRGQKTGERIKAGEQKTGDHTLKTDEQIASVFKNASARLRKDSSFVLKIAEMAGFYVAVCGAAGPRRGKLYCHLQTDRDFLLKAVAADGNCVI